MRIDITGRHVEITEALRNHVEQRLASRLGEFERLDDARVVLMIEKHRHIAEVVVRLPHHGPVESRRESSDMYTSIDEAADHVALQIRKWLEKRQDRKIDNRTRLAAGEPGGAAPA